MKNPLAGGAEVYMQEIFRRIVSQGHEVTQLAVRFPGSTETETIDGIKVIRFGGAQTFNFAVWARLNSILKQGKYDIVIDDLNKIPFFSPWFCDRPVLVMLMHVFRKSIFKEASFPLASYVYLTESLIPRCYKNNLFAVLSPSSKRDMQAFGIRDEQMTVIPPGTDTQRFRSDLSRKGRNLVIHVGRLKRYKSTDYLLHATKLLVERGWGQEDLGVQSANCRVQTAECRVQSAEYKAQSAEGGARRKDLKVVIVGDGDDLPRLKALSSELKLDRLVEFTGFIPEQDKVGYYQQAAVLVENSIKEGWGLIVMEANACGTPVVAARSPGLVDSVNDGETGLLYEYGNVAELADKIERLLSDARLRADMGQKGIAWADKYSWDSAADATLEMIERTMAQVGDSPGFPERKAGTVPGTS